MPGRDPAPILGPNGCGKTSLLELVSGMAAPDAGSVCLCRGWPEEAGRVPRACVLQDYRISLLPWRTGEENALLPALLAGEPRRSARERLAGLVEQLEVDLPLERDPYQMSGGQQQVLALLRGLMARPRLLVLDEPFSALDHHVTLRLRDRLLAWVAEHEATVVSVLHDVDDLIYLSDRILVVEGPPLRVARQVPVPLSRPRAPEMMMEPEFLAAKASVLSLQRA